jgi:hypothetical protein
VIQRVETKSAVVQSLTGYQTAIEDILRRPLEGQPKAQVVEFERIHRYDTIRRDHIIEGCSELLMPTPEEYESKIKKLEWKGLQKLWKAIKSRDTTGWDSGKAFEYLILRAFELDEAQVRWPYPVTLFGEEIEQIDGSVFACGLYCLVEGKDEIENVAIAPIAKLRNQLLRRPAGTIGMLFSSGKFTEPAVHLAHFALPQAVLLWTGDEVEYILTKRNICESLELKYRACVDFGISDYNIRTREIS